MAQSKTTEPGEIVLLAGPPGAGKTTVARELVALADGPTASIEGDVFWHFFVKGNAGSPGSKTRMKHSRIIIKAMMLAALPYARGGYRVIVDFSIGPWFLDLFDKWMEGTAFSYVILCPSEAACAARAAARNEGAVPEYGPYRELHAAFADLGALERYAVRRDDADPLALATLIRDGLAAGTYRLELPLAKG